MFICIKCESKFENINRAGFMYSDCPECKSKMSGVLEEKASIRGTSYYSKREPYKDATGKYVGREGVEKKLAITRTEKGWQNDIKARRILPNGQIARIRDGQRVG